MPTDPGDPIDRIAALVGDAVERLEGYSRIAMGAAERNARGEYGADDLLADVQAVWQQVVRDTATATANLIDALAGTERDQ